MAQQKFTYLRKLNGVAMPCTLVIPIGASQTIVKGDLIKVDSTNGLGIIANAASTGIIGIANASITTGSSVTNEALEVILVDEFTVLKANIAGTTKTSVVLADCFGKSKFDITTNQAVNLDDTTGGFIIPITKSNAAKEVEVVISQAALWNA